MNLDEYNDLKAAVEREKLRHERAIGAYNAALEQLRSQWECKTLEEARAKLKKMRSRHDELGEKLDAHIKQFKKAWVHLLKDDSE